MTEQPLLEGKVILRPDDKGEFDELFLMEGEECRVHMEMMSGTSLWIGIYPRDARNGGCASGSIPRASCASMQRKIETEVARSHPLIY